MATPKRPDIQGHRGCRGYYPENTLNGFIKALEMGVDTLEMDVVVSRDHKVVVSHEPYFNPIFSTHPEGVEVTPENQYQWNIYQMDYAEIRRWDVGSKGHALFPMQEKAREYKPLLSEVFQTIESNYDRAVYYNIELKRSAKYDGIFHPDGETFVQLVLECLNRHEVNSRVSLQCFDKETLRTIRRLDEEQATVLLIDDDIPMSDHIAELGFTPDIYSPHYRLVDRECVRLCREHDLQLIPWTVNDSGDAEKLIALGVDGIITDYPDLLDRP